jgi:hypothetical protein
MKEIPYKEGKMKDIGAREGYAILWGRVRSVGPGCNVQLSGGTATSRACGVLRDSRSVSPMGVGGCLVLYGGLYVLRGCGRVCPNTSYGPW